MSAGESGEPSCRFNGKLTAINGEPPLHSGQKEGF